MHLAYALAGLVLPARARRQFRRRWARQLLEILGIGLDSAPLSFAPGTLLVANHVSWLDVLVLNTLLDCSFIAKAEARRWPVLGRLLQAHDTLFVVRRPGRHLLAINAQIAGRLARDEAVVLFPEGTTSDGASVLEFKPAHFEPALRGGHAIRPVAIHYVLSRHRCPEAAFISRQNLWDSLCGIARLDGLCVRIEVAQAIPTEGLARREAAALARAAIVERLWGGFNLGGRPTGETASGSEQPMKRGPGGADVAVV